MDRIAAAARLPVRPAADQAAVPALPADVVPRSLAEGYEVQDRLVRKLLDHFGGRPDRLQDRLHQRAGPEGPRGRRAVLRRRSCPAPRSRAGRSCAASDFTVRCAEAEFGFEMAADVPAGPAYTAESIQRVHRRGHAVHRDRRPPVPRLADGRRPVAAGRQRDPRRLGRGRAVRRRGGTSTSPNTRRRSIVNGDATLTGSGAAVLGNPLNVVAWLANELPRVRPAAEPRGPGHDRRDDRHLPGGARRPPGGRLRADRPRRDDVRLDALLG